jgi:hypothetical protein
MQALTWHGREEATMNADRTEGEFEDRADDYAGEEVPDEARPGEETFGEAQQEADELNEQGRDADEGGSGG